MFVSSLSEFEVDLSEYDTKSPTLRQGAVGTVRKGECEIQVGIKEESRMCSDSH